MLDEIGKALNTDKASATVRKGETRQGHDYLRHYDAAVEPLRNRIHTVLDLGVGVAPNAFASAKMWREYLPDATVVSVDVRRHENPDDDAIEFVQMDLGSPRNLSILAARNADLIVDDASHLWSHQLLALIYLLPSVRPGGLFIVEDIHTSSDQLADRYADGAPLPPTVFLGHLASTLSAGHPHFARPASEPRVAEWLAETLAAVVDSITFVRGSAILRVKN